MEPKDIQKHIFGTYVSLRRGLWVLGLALPFFLVIVGSVQGVAWQDSISAYYWATPHDEESSALAQETRAGQDQQEARETQGAQEVEGAESGETPPMRNWFVAFLCATGVLLHLYKGFSKEENIALNVAGILAVCVALIPMAWGANAGGPSLTVLGKTLTLHGACAVGFFLCLILVVWRRSKDTLRYLPEDARRSRRWYERQYRVCVVLMGLAPVIAVVLVAFPGFGGRYIFFLETIPILTFAYYWWVKSGELRESSATVRELHLDESLAGEVAGEALRG